jgi:hypothetical protein
LGSLVCLRRGKQEAKLVHHSAFDPVGSNLVFRKAGLSYFFDACVRLFSIVIPLETYDLILEQFIPSSRSRADNRALASREAKE